MVIMPNAHGYTAGAGLCTVCGKNPVSQVPAMAVPACNCEENKIACLPKCSWYHFNTRSGYSFPGRRTVVPFPGGTTPTEGRGHQAKSVNTVKVLFKTNCQTIPAAALFQ